MSKQLRLSDYPNTICWAPSTKDGEKVGWFGPTHACTRGEHKIRTLCGLVVPEHAVCESYGDGYCRRCENIEMRLRSEAL